MLQKIGDSLKGQKWLAYIVLGALILVFAVWGAYGIVDLTIGTTAFAAKVNDQEIPIESARESWSQQQSQWQQTLGQDVPESMRARLQDDLLEAMVRNALMTQRSRDLGYRVSPQQLRQAIAAEPAFQIDGKYNAAAAKGALVQVGMSLAEYEADLRSRLQRGQLQDSIRDSDFVTPRERERLNALQNEQREIRYVRLPIETFASTVKVNEAAIKAYYDKNANLFQTPESVKLEYAELRLDELAAQMQVTDAEVRATFEKNRARYSLEERRRARHILFQVASPGDDKEARSKAEAVLGRVRSGGDFAQLARENSQDPGSASQGGDLGWVERNYFEAPFAEALFAMKPGEVRGPVKTQSGYHIIKLDEIQAGKSQSLEEARAQIESQLRHDQAADRFGDIQESLQSRLEQGEGDLDGLAKDFGLRTGVTDFVRGTGAPALGDAPALGEAVFAPAVLNERRVGGPVALGEDRLVIFKALEHTKPQARPIPEVRDEMIAAVKREQGSKLAFEKAVAARRQVESGTSFDEVARQLGVRPETSRLVSRGDADAPAQVREAVFSSPRPTQGKLVVRAVELDDAAALVTVTAVRVAPPAGPQLQARSMRDAAQRHGVGDVVAYVEESRRQADVEKNPQAFDY